MPGSTTRTTRPIRLHLDSDLGGDTDDACALAMLLGWPDVELTGITTVLDVDGRRAGYVAHLLELAGRHDVPIAAGAAMSMTRRERADPIVGDERYWPRGLPFHPSPPGAALDLLQRSIDAHSTVVAIGCYTNLAVLDLMRPGALAGARVVVMGGWLEPPADGLPAWGPDMDFNVQWDTQAAQILLAAGADLTLVTLPATLTACVSGADLARLRASGPLGTLLARQAQAHGTDHAMTSVGRANAGLPNDLLNFQYDPLACAVALGWPGVRIDHRRLRTVLDGDLLRFTDDDRGHRVSVVASADGPAFNDVWLRAVEVADAPNDPTYPGL